MNRYPVSPEQARANLERVLAGASKIIEQDLKAKVKAGDIAGSIAHANRAAEMFAQIRRASEEKSRQKWPNAIDI